MLSTATFPIQKYNIIEAGLGSFQYHLSGSSSKFPRRISTFESNGKQFQVDNTEECLIAFRDANYRDCRINAFPILREGKYWIPDFIFIDIDNQKSIDSVLTKTLSNIRKYLGSDAKPTVLFSGNGYHVLQPVTCPANDYQIKQHFKNFTQVCANGNPNEEFLRFMEIFLSEGKADPNHNPSFASCMLRVPNTINSKNGKKVRILQKWNVYRPELKKELFVLFEEYLIQKQVDEKLKQERVFKEQQKRKKLIMSFSYSNSCYYDWIDKLLETPLPDYRKTIIGLILAPYLIRRKNLDFETSFNNILEWLDKCNQVKRLDNSNFNSRIKDALKNAQNKPYGPMSFEKIKFDTKYHDLYLLLVSNNIGEL